MNISVDGGALCASPDQFLGTSIFTENFLEAIKRYDTGNNYRVYTFCPLEEISQNISIKQIRPKAGFMKVGVSRYETIYPSAVFLGLNQTFPLYTRAKRIGFCHGLSYYYHPSSYSDSYKRLMGQFKEMITYSDCIVVSSKKVKKELQSIYPALKAPVITVPFGVPFEFQTTIKRKRSKFFLYVGSNAPIKQVESLVETSHDYQLVLVGQHAKFRGQKNIRIFSSVSRDQLKKLYQEAAAYLTMSLYESFNFPVLEALSQNCPVISTPGAIISELTTQVHIAKNVSEFRALLKQTAAGKIHYNKAKEIREQFSWKSYVVRLNNLYETIGSHTDQKRSG